MAQPEEITVSARSAQAIRERMVADGYSSVDEVIGAALDALTRDARNKAEDLAWVKAKVRASVEDTRPGYSSDEIRQHLDDLLARAEGQHRDSAA